MSQGFLQLEVSLFLDCLRVLKTFDKFHFELLHLGDFVHFHRSHAFLLVALGDVLASSYALLPPSLLLNFHLGESLGLQANLILHLIFLLHAEEVLALALLVLLFDHFGLLRFFFFLQQEGVLNFLFLLIALLRNHVVVLRHMPFLLVLKLNIEDFLKHRSEPFIFTYLLHFLLVSLLESGDVTSSFFGFFNLFPGFHFFLLKESNTVSQELGVTVNTKDGVRQGSQYLLFSPSLDFSKGLSLVFEIHLFLLLSFLLLLGCTFHFITYFILKMTIKQL